jgi:hypothetical protein
MEGTVPVGGSALEPLDFRKIWEGALTFDQFVAQARPEHQALWQGIYRHAKSPDWAIAAVDGRRLHFLAISEDWCMDTSNTIPFLQRLAESVPGVDLRLILRDKNPEVMDRYLTKGSRSIPVLIILDGQFHEVGRWGPRPADLQAWVITNRPLLPKSDIVKEERRWYARDKGETTIRDVLESIPRTSTPS